MILYKILLNRQDLYTSTTIECNMFKLKVL